jgi:LemA protein
MIIWILVAILAVVVLWLIFIFNSLIRLKNRVNEAWADIDVQLKRRYDLIPNLIETVKGYAKHERSLFEKVTEARTKAISAKTVKEQGKAENMLAGTLKSLFAVAENYPNLRANENFLALQNELTDTEDKVQAARRFYNGNVRDFNIKIEVFPNNLVAKMLGFSLRDLFEIEEAGEREAPKVKF